MYKTVKQNQGKMILIGLNTEIKKVFDITKLSNLFEIYDNLEKVN